MLTNYVESGGNYLALTDGFGNWTGGYVRGVITQKNNIWSAEINGQHEFGDAGVYFGAGDTYNFTPIGTAHSLWAPALEAFSGLVSGRTDSLTKSGGAAGSCHYLRFGYYRRQRHHRDDRFFVGSASYFKKPWILEEGFRFNISNPGSVFSPAGFIAVTQGRNQQHYITIRAGLRKEAYRLIGPTSAITDFHSQTLTITWRQWVGPRWGINVVTDYYHNRPILEVVRALDSSRSFEHRNGKGFDPPKGAAPVHARGHRGGVISMHRALIHFRLGTMNLITASCLFVFFFFAWLLLLPRVCPLWTRIFMFGVSTLPLRAELGMAEHHWTPFLNFNIPYLRIEAALPAPKCGGSVCRHIADVRGYLLYFSEPDSCHLSLSCVACASDHVVIFCTSSSPFSSHPG